MTHSPSPRNPSQLSPSNSRHLDLYALGAAAAGVALLALPQSAAAKVVYTPVHHTVGRNQRYQVDLDRDKVSDLTFVNTYGCNFDYCTDALSADGSGGNAIAGKYTLAYALPAGAKIGPKISFNGKIMALSSSSEGNFGQWTNVSKKYLGVKFNIGHKTHYGWLRLNVRLSGHARITATITGYAYETIPNRPIIAGKTKGKDVVAARRDSLGYLAAGALVR